MARHFVANVKKLRGDSTYWLYFELLWREFFHWRAVIDGSSLFVKAVAQGDGC